MEVSVDQESCHGTGYCMKVCPDVFGFDEERRVAVVLEPHPTGTYEDQLEEAERLCPTGAVTVV